ncbi:MAG: carbohydrate-binding protein [Chloroflexota bacterium]
MELSNRTAHPFIVLLTVSIIAGILLIVTYSIRAHQQSISQFKDLTAATEATSSDETMATEPDKLVDGQDISSVVSIEALVDQEDIIQVDFMLTGLRGVFRSRYDASYFFSGSKENKPVGWDTTQYPDGDYTLTITTWSTQGVTHTKQVSFHITNQRTQSTTIPQNSITAMYIPLTQETTSPSNLTIMSANTISLPGRIEAEDYRKGGNDVGYYDTTPGNTGTSYRTDDVDIQSCGEKDACYNVGWMDAGKWLAYDVTFATSGEYTFVARAAALGNGKHFHILLND